MTCSPRRGSTSPTRTSSPPRSTQSITDGSEIAVQFGRPLELSVDGESQTYWVNSTNVASALGEIGRRFEGADLSTSRSSSIGRTGLTLQVVTPKVVRIKLGAKDLRKHKVTALTVADVLESMGFEVDRHDKVTPSLTTEIAAGRQGRRQGHPHRDEEGQARGRRRPGRRARGPHHVRG